MKVSVYSITRDRLEYTQRSFESLRKNAGYEFRHIVIDNGSTDGTKEWIQANPELFDEIILLEKNYGISIASNMAVKMALDGLADLVIKMDNDCLVKSENIIGQIVEMYESLRSDRVFDSQYVLSPRVSGIHRQPTRISSTQIAGRKVGLTGIVGGLFHVVPFEIYTLYRYPENLPLAKGQDDHFCDWVLKNGGRVGYIEGLEVEHMDGTEEQFKKFPEYFERKFREEKEMPK